MTPRSMAYSVFAGTLIAILLAVLSSCAGDPYQERMDYLRVVAQRGAETHALLEAQGATIDKKRCEAAFRGLDDSKEPNAGDDGGLYADQVQQFFVDSCISGRPMPAPGQSAGASAPVVPSTAAPSVP